MKAITRCTPLLLLLFVLASTAVWANTVTVGTLTLLPSTPGTSDTLEVGNYTGLSGALGEPTTDQTLNFSGMSATINGSTLIAFSPTTVASGNVADSTTTIPFDTITSLSFQGTLGSTNPVSVTVGGVPETLSPTLSIVPFPNGYSTPLDTVPGGTACDINCPEFDIVATSVAAPEPSIVALFGASLCFLRRRKAKA